MLIKGSDLNQSQRKQVLNAFVHRNTIEHPAKWAKDQKWSLPIGRIIETDTEWVNAHAFYFVKDGSRLAFRPKHAVPSYLAEPEPKRIRCNQCEALMINEVFCHETGCPNTNARYDSESGECQTLETRESRKSARTCPVLAKSECREKQEPR